MALTKITSDVIGSGAVESTHIASGAISSSHLTGITTDNVSEGSSNTYFTNARARGAVSVTGGNLSYDSSSGVIQLTTGTIRAQLSGGTGVTYNSTSGAISIGQSVATDATPTFGNTTLTGYLRGPSTFTIDPATHGDDTGTVVIAGNLQVDGTTTTINSTTLTVDDKLVTLASGSANAGAANGAGIEVDISGATNPSLLYDGTNDQWDFNKSLHIVNNTTDDTILLESTEDSNLAAPVLTFKRHSSSPADADYLGQLKFRGENDADQDIVYAKMTSKISDASDGSEDGTLEFAVRKAGANNINMRLGPNSLQIINGTNLTVGALTSGKTGTLTINNEGGNTATLQVLSRTNRSILRVADNDTNGYISAENDIFSIGRNTGLNSANINIDSSNKVGIGTSAPSNKLHVAGVTNTDGIKIQGAEANVSLIIENDATNGVAWDISSTGGGHGYGDGALHFGVAFGQPKVKFQSDGKVGIGTNSPNRTLNLHVAANDSNFTQFTNSTTGEVGSNGFLVGIGSAGNAELWNYEAQPIIFATSSSERARIDSSGNFGIGTNSPSQALHVAGGSGSMILNESTSWSYLRLKSPNTNGGYIQFADADDDDVGQIFYYHGSGGDYMSFTTNASERMRIASDGKVGIATTSPSSTLTVNGTIEVLKDDNNAANEGGQITLRSPSNATTLKRYGLDTYNSGGASVFRLFHENDSDGSSGAVALEVNHSGDLKVTSKIKIKADNNYLEVDQATATNLQFYLTGYQMGGIKRIGSADAGSFRPNQYSSGATAAQYPAHAEWNDENSGVYFPAADKVGLTAGGTTRLETGAMSSTDQAAVKINNTSNHKAGKLTIYGGSSSGMNGGILHWNGVGREYRNVVSTHTAAASSRYWHIKTNILATNYVMFIGRVHGYSYGNSGHIVDIQRSGYAHSSAGTLSGVQVVNNGSSSDTLTLYYSSDNYIVFKHTTPSSGYYSGYSFDIKMQSPTGYNFNFEVLGHAINSTSGNHY